ncbi:GGDEF domain-containing protein [Sphingomonas paeninsulae]|uniref:GGDEF domain-containing protein n=1 Tax=Sphingomonas paeninsulae TaxID=2319844 RepID=A0A494TDK1_SPHPE|nr:GGDEF domain-containing protein [Sphingomonas paeninsulae]AYJ87300.1 GGDEF domain-containing protein [Sphingomonas paeninsulae]
MQKLIIKQLGGIASVAHAVRSNREMSLRAPTASIAEVASLSGDFNALLDELEQRQTHLRFENESLTHIAEHDALTNLLNRASFERRLTAMANDAAAHDQSFAVLYLDADQFKAINDGHGHAAGDVVLQTLAVSLKACLRSGDAAGRLGGDEFAVLLGAPSDMGSADYFMDALHVQLLNPITLPTGDELLLGVSCGAAVFPVDGTSAAELLRKADKAMYREKHSRRARDPSAEGVL